jgi:hypothetical protein
MQGIDRFLLTTQRGYRSQVLKASHAIFSMMAHCLLLDVDAVSLLATYFPFSYIFSYILIVYSGLAAVIAGDKRFRGPSDRPVSLPNLPVL